MPLYWSERYRALEVNERNHCGHAFNTDHLLEIERCLPQSVLASAETGCGKSTIIFSNISEQHHVFALDDRAAVANSSVLFFEQCPLTRIERISRHFGPTQKTLPQYIHMTEYDIVLIDGPHGFPFPEIEYYYFYPHIRTGGFLLVDDVNIPTIARLADVIAEDEMFEVFAIVRTTAIFRRTDANTFDPFGDGWWTQRYNRRRVSSQRDIYLPTSDVHEEFSQLHLDRNLFGDSDDNPS